jgi:hypothetical protein
VLSRRGRCLPRVLWGFGGLGRERLSCLGVVVGMCWVDGVGLVEVVEVERLGPRLRQSWSPGSGLVEV